MIDGNGKATFARAVFSFFIVAVWLVIATQGSAATPGTPLRHTDNPSVDLALHAPVLTVVRPNGGEVWEAGSEEPVLWAYSGLTGDVRLEYSLDGAQSWKTIVEATPGTAGAYMWTIPDAPSTDAYVRVGSTLDATISDTSDAPFTLVTVKGFEDSFATASPVHVSGGDTVTFTVVLFESESAAVTVTDTLPSSLTYVTDTLHVAPAWKNPGQYIDGDVRWSGLVTRTVPVSIKFRTQVTNTTSTLVIVNPIQVSRNGAKPVELTATVIVDGYPVSLPIVLKD